MLCNKSICIQFTLFEYILQASFMLIITYPMVHMCGNLDAKVQYSIFPPVYSSPVCWSTQSRLGPLDSYTSQLPLDISPITLTLFPCHKLGTGLATTLQASYPPYPRHVSLGKMTHWIAINHSYPLICFLFYFDYQTLHGKPISFST